MRIKVINFCCLVLTKASCYYLNSLFCQYVPVLCTPLILCLVSLEVPFTLHHHPDHPEKSTFVYATTTVSPADTNASVPVPQGYLVWSNSCKIASLNPMAADVMKLYYREKPISCSSKVPLTNVFWDAQKQKYYLRVVKEAQKAYSFRSESSCVCKEVVRKSENQIGWVVKFLFHNIGCTN